MILTVEESAELELPAGWLELPPAQVLQTDDWMWEWVESGAVARDRREPFTEALRKISAYVRSHPRRDERTWIVIADLEARNDYFAMASVGLADPGESLVSEMFTDHEPWLRMTGEADAAGTLVDAHEFTVATFGSSRIIERYVGEFTPTGSGLTARLEITTASVDVFCDLVSMGRQALTRLRVL